jgi:hypothetical protein
MNPSWPRPVMIRHDRCGEYDTSTYVLAPADWDEDRIAAGISAAQDAYLDAYRRVSATPDEIPSPPYQPEFAKYPNSTVAEVIANHANDQARYNSWRLERKDEHKRFESFLCDQGFIGVWDEPEGVYSEYVNWGHAHGANYRYGNDNTDTFVPVKEFASAKRRKKKPR